MTDFEKIHSFESLYNAYERRGKARGGKERRQSLKLIFLKR